MILFERKLASSKVVESEAETVVTPSGATKPPEEHDVLPKMTVQSTAAFKPTC